VATIENANKQKASATQLVDGRQEKVWSRIQVEFRKKKTCQLIKKKSKNDTVKRFDHRTLQSPHYNTLVVVHSGRHPKTCPCVCRVCQSHHRRNHFHFPPLLEDFVKLEKKGKSFCSKYCRRILILLLRWRVEIAKNINFYRLRSGERRKISNSINISRPLRERNWTRLVFFFITKRYVNFYIQEWLLAG
jgi:hypothetical protein